MQAHPPVYRFTLPSGMPVIQTVPRSIHALRDSILLAVRRLALADSQAEAALSVALSQYSPTKYHRNKHFTSTRKHTEMLAEIPCEVNE